MCIPISAQFSTSSEEALACEESCTSKVSCALKHTHMQSHNNVVISKNCDAILDMADLTDWASMLVMLRPSHIWQRGLSSPSGKVGLDQEWAVTKTSLHASLNLSWLVPLMEWWGGHLVLLVYFSMMWQRDSNLTQSLPKMELGLTGFAYRCFQVQSQLLHFMVLRGATMERCLTSPF